MYDSGSVFFICAYAKLARVWDLGTTIPTVMAAQDFCPQMEGVRGPDTELEII